MTASNRSSKSILAIDDEYDIVNLIQESLQRHRFKVCTFTKPSAALEHFISHLKDYGPKDDILQTKNATIEAIDEYLDSHGVY